MPTLLLALVISVAEAGPRARGDAPETTSEAGAVPEEASRAGAARWRCAAPAASSERGRRGDEPPPSLVDATALTEADLAVLVADLIPLVETAAGARFTTPPTIGTTDAAGLADIVAGETRDVLRNLYDAPEHMLDAMAERSRASVGGILGKYAPATGKVYLGLQPLARAVAESTLAPEQTLDAACLVLAHELTHALQDQAAAHGDRFAKVGDMDAFNGLRAVSEGHAVFVEERVAEELGLVDVFWALNRQQGWGPDGLEEPAAFPLWGLYGQGRTFVRHHFEAGGQERVWTLLRAPPTRTAHIFRPERWSPDHAAGAPSAPGSSANAVGSPASSPNAPGNPTSPSTEPDLAAALAGVEQKLTKGEWAVVSGTVGEYELRADMAGLPQDVADDVLAHLVRAHQRDLTMPDRQAHVRVLDFDSPEAPFRYVERLSQAQDAMAAALSTPAGEWTVEVMPYDAVEGDAVIRRKVAPKAPHASALETQSVWVVRGSRLVVVQVQRFRPGLRMDWTLEEVFARLEP